MNKLNVNEVASKYRVTERTVRRWISKEDLPYRKVLNRIEIDLSELEKWVEERTIIRK